jgi:hypothetical protein
VWRADLARLLAVLEREADDIVIVAGDVCFGLLCCAAMDAGCCQSVVVLHHEGSANSKLSSN